MKKSILITHFFLFIIGVSVAQKPMSKLEIQTRLDSLEVESKLIIDLVSKQKKLENFLTSKELNISNLKFINFYFHDTLYTTVMFHSKKLRFFHESDTFISIVNNSYKTLLSIESTHINKMIALKEYSTKQKTNLPNGFYFEFYYLGLYSQGRLYQLSSTNKNDVIPFGGDHLYLSKDNEIIEQITFYEFHPKLIQQTTNQLFLVYRDDTKYILPTDIYKFKRYNPLQKLTKLSAFSRRNKVMFEYNQSKNEIKIKSP